MYLGGYADPLSELSADVLEVDGRHGDDDLRLGVEGALRGNSISSLTIVKL